MLNFNRFPQLTYYYRRTSININSQSQIHSLIFKFAFLYSGYRKAVFQYQAMIQFHFQRTYLHKQNIIILFNLLITMIKKKQQKQPTLVQNRRRSSYTPIMLTSKSIRPLQRANPFSQIHQYGYNRKLSAQNPGCRKNTSLYQNVMSKNQQMDLILAAEILKKSHYVEYYNNLPFNLKQQVINEISEQIEVLINSVQKKKNGQSAKMIEESENNKIKQDIQQEEAGLSNRYNEGQNYREWVSYQRQKKNNTTSIIKMQLNDNICPPVRKNHNSKWNYVPTEMLNLRGNGINKQSTDILNQVNQQISGNQGNYSNHFKKFMYFTNSKTCNGFTHPAKVSSASQTKRQNVSSSNNLPSEQTKIEPPSITASYRHQRNKFQGQNEEWDKFLFKHYLNIKKVNPRSKRENGIDIKQLPPEKAQQLQARVEAIMAKNHKKILANDKNRNFASNQQTSQTKNSPFDSEIGLTNQKTLSRIQQDMNLIARKQFNNGKKQFFVFGLGDSKPAANVNNQTSLKTKLDRYRDFLFKINFSNGVYVKVKEQIQRPYKFYIGFGNNAALVRGIFKRRYWWQIVDLKQKDWRSSSQTCPNFVWTQLRMNQYMSIIPSRNKSLTMNFFSNFRNRPSRSIRKRMIESSKNKQAKKQFENKQPRTPLDNTLRERQLSLQKLQEQNYKTSSPKNQGRQNINIHDQGLFANEAQEIQDINIQQNSKILGEADLVVWKNHYQKHRRLEDKLSEAIYSKRFQTMIRKKPMVLIQESSTIKVHNHFECNFYLGNKKALFYYMSRYYKAKQINPFKVLPLTFHLSKGVEDPQFSHFMQQYDKLNGFKVSKQNSDRNFKNIWIVKPGQYTNRGKGITVCSTLDQIKVRLKGRQKNPVSGDPRSFIIQKYIEKPLLYNRRKFDIRHYMLMTCFNGQFKGYWFSEGYLRTTSYEYNIKNTKDLYTHLTNDAVQKCSTDYGKFEKGNKLSYQQFQKYMEEKLRPSNSTVSKKKKNKSQQIKQENQNQSCGYNFFTDTLPVMKQIAADTMRATYESLSPNRKAQTFELFGLDFMLDQELKVYLIEVNTNPCLETSCPILMKIISGLMENVFKICVDPFFPPPLEWQNSKKFQMGDNSLDQNKFELIFDQIAQGQQISRLLNGVAVGNIGEVAQQDDQYQDQGNQWNQQV